jgi:hypothetical protein
MSYTVKEAKVGNETVRIVQDSFVESPRSWDNLAKMIFTGGHTHLGDKHEVDFNLFFESRQDFIDRGEEVVRKHFKDVVVCYPVHLYEHSGTSISISDSYPYNCRWDSGTIGFAIVTKEDIRKNWNIKRVTKEYIEQADRILKGEVETLNQYVMGEVYGFIVEDENGEHIDSCYGFYGSDIEENGIADYLEKKYLEVLVD